MKRRIIAATICFVLLCIASMYLGYLSDSFLRRVTSSISYSPFIALRGAWVGRAKLLTLIFIVGSAFAVLTCVLMPEYVKYKSAMHEIIPGVKTPEHAGQGQYGNAHWLPTKDIPKVFASAQIDAENPYIEKLIALGYTDLKQKGESKDE